MLGFRVLGLRVEGLEFGDEGSSVRVDDIILHYP